MITDEQILKVLRKHQNHMLEQYTRCFYEDTWEAWRINDECTLEFAREVLALKEADDVQP